MSCNHKWGGVVIPGPVNRIIIDQCENCGELRIPDAAPPAQAVDLGPGDRAMLARCLRYCRGVAVDDWSGAEIDRLLALIDSLSEVSRG